MAKCYKGLIVRIRILVEPHHINNSLSVDDKFYIPSYPLIPTFQHSFNFKDRTPFVYKSHQGSPPLWIHGHHIRQNVITAVRRVSLSIQTIECVGECGLIYIPPKVCLLCVGINRNKSKTHSHQTQSKWKAFYYGNCRECCQRYVSFIRWITLISH